MTCRKTKSSVDFALQIHLEETGHNVQFKEEWIYDPAVRQPHLKGMQERIILRGNTRFEAAHAIIELPDGSRWFQTLGPRARSLEQVTRLECGYTIGKPQCIEPTSRLPIFEENTHDIPSGYGIEHSADGGFYPYEIDVSDPSRVGRLKDTCGLDMRCGDRDEAIAVLMLEVLA